MINSEQTRFTKHQIPRGSRADAEDWGHLYLLKGCSNLRATYQIKLLTYFASEEKKKLIIRIPKECKIHDSIKRLKDQAPNVIQIERRESQ